MSAFVALSINSGGMSEGEIEYNGEDWTNVTGFGDVRSVDVVTRPGAGGAFLSLTESTTGAPVKNREGNMLSKKVRKSIALLESADKALKATQDETKRKTLEKARAAAQAAMLKALQEAEKKPKEAEESEDESAEEAEDESEDEAEDEDGVDHMDALKQHVPQGPDENNQQYADRLGSITSHAVKAGAAAAPSGEDESEEDEDGEPPMLTKKGAKPGMQQSAALRGRARHRESALVKDFRKKQPQLYTQIMESARNVLSIERGDFKGLRQMVETQSQQIARLQLERELTHCEKMIREAGIPAKWLKPAKLMKMEEAERKEEIERTLLIMEGAGQTRIFDGGGSRNIEGAGDGGFDGLDSLGTPVEPGEDE